MALRPSIQHALVTSVHMSSLSASCPSTEVVMWPLPGSPSHQNDPNKPLAFTKYPTGGILLQHNMDQVTVIYLAHKCSTWTGLRMAAHSGSTRMGGFNSKMAHSLS
jgi:hypothetical protein